MVSRFYSHHENQMAEPAAECFRKFNLAYDKTVGMPGEAVCVDCGETWSVHANFYCIETRKSYWTRPNPYNSVIRDSASYVLLAPPPGAPAISSAVQTTKESQMKPIAVLSHNLADPNATGIVSGTFETSEAAKEFAEGLVAQGQANLTARTFRTLTIVNTRTGELIGVNVQAAPTVDWGS